MTQHPPAPARTVPPPFYRTQDTPIAFDFYDEARGWLVVDNSTAVSLNGGANWTTETQLSNLLATSNGGSSWTTIYTTTGEIYSISFGSLTDGWFTIGDTLFATHNGGVTWEASTVFTYDTMWEAQFLDTKNGWVTWWDHQQYRGGMVHTTDGGLTWSQAADPCPGEWHNSFSFVSPMTGWILCTSEPAGGMMWKALYRSDDGGSSWQALGSLSKYNHASDISFADEKYGWYSSGRAQEGKILVTTDGGVSWKDELGTGHASPGGGRPTKLLLLSRALAYEIKLDVSDSADCGFNYRYRLLKLDFRSHTGGQLYPPCRSKTQP